MGLTNESVEVGEGPFPMATLEVAALELSDVRRQAISPISQRLHGFTQVIDASGQRQLRCGQFLEATFSLSSQTFKRLRQLSDPHLGPLLRLHQLTDQLRQCQELIA